MTSTLQQEADVIVIALPTETAMDLSRKIAKAWKTTTDKGHDKVVLLCDSRLRSPLAEMLSRIVPMLPVVAYDEVVLGTEVEPTETISLQQFKSDEPKEQEFVVNSK
jgi:flagellar biosynthesis component FlhA